MLPWEIVYEKNTIKLTTVIIRVNIYTFLNEYSVIYDVNKTNIEIPNAIVMEGDEENINEFYICINVNNETTSVEIINLFIDSVDTLTTSSGV